MEEGIYGYDSYSTLRKQVVLALTQDGMPGSNNSISHINGEVYSGRHSWEPYDTFLIKMGLDTGPDYAANYEPYFLQGLMNTNAGKVALEKAKFDYLNRRNLATASEADILEY
jgi:hypothetical protein